MLQSHAWPFERTLQVLPQGKLRCQYDVVQACILPGPLLTTSSQHALPNGCEHPSFAAAVCWSALCCSPLPCLQIAVALGRTVYLWDAAAGGVEELFTMPNEGDYVGSVAWSADGAYLAVSSICLCDRTLMRSAGSRGSSYVDRTLGTHPAPQ